jgi:hypothetical protein
VTTANDLIERAYRRGRVVGIDQVITASESSEALEELNDLLDEWWNERLAVYQITQEQFSLVSGQASRTIGPSGNFNTNRPVRIAEGSFVRRSGVDYELAILEDRESYDGISVKTTAGLARYVFYDPGVSLGTLYFYPVPDAADSLFLNSWKRLQTLAALTTDIALPPGYNRLIVNGLAISLCHENGLEAPAGVHRAFDKTKAALKRLNAPAAIMEIDRAMLGVGRRHDITVDG